MDLIKLLVLPSSFIAICFILGFLALPFNKIRKAAFFAFATGALTYIILSIGPVSYILLKPFEFRYAALKDATVQDVEPAFIVVMAGYAVDESYYPVSSKANAASLFRLVEALRLWRQNPIRKIIISGYGRVPEILKSVMSSMGVPEEIILIDDQSADSHLSAKNVGGMIDDRPFYLVTSAGHMPRAMAAFKKRGLSPIAAPTDFQTGKDPFKADLFPSVLHLYYSEMAVHEFFGMMWYRIRGLI